MNLTENQIIEKAKQLKYCTSDLHECFEGELCPISHSTACCLHCSEATHKEASKEMKAKIKEMGHCGEIHCFRAKAIMLFNADIPQPKRPINYA